MPAVFVCNTLHVTRGNTYSFAVLCALIAGSVVALILTLFDFRSTYNFLIWLCISLTVFLCAMHTIAPRVAREIEAGAPVNPPLRKSERPYEFWDQVIWLAFISAQGAAFGVGMFVELVFHPQHPSIGSLAAGGAAVAAALFVLVYAGSKSEMEEIQFPYYGGGS